MKHGFIKLVTIILIIVSFIGTVAVYPRLPAQIPIHFNLNGVVDGAGPNWLIFVFAALPMLIYSLMLFVPKIDPKKSSYVKHSASFSIVSSMLSIFFVIINWMIILLALGSKIDVIMVMSILLGVLFITIGLNLPAIKQNYTYGIKTPWTLESEVIWNKTHRLGGVLFTASGIFTLITAFISQPVGFIITLVLIVLSTIIPIIYSYSLYKNSN